MDQRVKREKDIATISSASKRWPEDSHTQALINEVQRLEAEAKRLRKIIEDAPHEEGCSYFVTYCHDGAIPKCDCWKAQALREEGAATDQGTKP